MSGAPIPLRPGPPPRVSIPLPHVSLPLKRFLAAEAGSGALLLAAALAALLWANLAGNTYETTWATEAAVRAGDATLALDLRHWVNEAAMALFFLAVGLEISREVSVGELHSLRAVFVPAVGAIGGLLLPAVIYLVFNHDGPGARGWGIAMSTDTAFVIGILALFGPSCPDQLRLFLLTLSIVDDIGAITVMAVFYSGAVSVPALAVAGFLVAVIAGLRWLGVWQLRAYAVAGLALWVAVYASGVHPTLAGVLLGLLVPASPVGPEQLDRLRFYGRAVAEGADALRARLAASAARAAVPANDRLQDALHPISAYLVVPLFGLANAGARLNGEALRQAAASPITIGVLVGLLAGKTVGISGSTALALRARLGDLPGRVRYGHLVGGSVLSGVGFTLALFIAGLAFDDQVLREQARLGALAGSLVAALLGSVALRYLGERLPLCSIADEAEEPPPLPPGPWRDPSLTS